MNLCIERRPASGTAPNPKNDRQTHRSPVKASNQFYGILVLPA
jgi:hypothetical protein